MFPFKAAAFDRTAGVDQQNVTFMVTVQHSPDNGTTWKNGSSVSETRTAWDNKSAKFDTLKVLTTANQVRSIARVVTLKWLRNWPNRWARQGQHGLLQREVDGR